MRLEAITVKRTLVFFTLYLPMCSASRRFAVPADCFASLRW